MNNNYLIPANTKKGQILNICPFNYSYFYYANTYFLINTTPVVKIANTTNVNPKYVGAEPVET